MYIRISFKQGMILYSLLGPLIQYMEPGIATELKTVRQELRENMKELPFDERVKP